MRTKPLLKKRRKISSKIPRIEECVRGSLVMMRRACGKPGCRCQKGQKHHSLYLSQSNNGKTKMIYLPREAEDKANRYVKNYQKIKSVLNNVSDINIKLLTGRRSS